MAAAVKKDKGSMTLTLVNARLIDPEQEAPVTGALRIEDGRIAAIGDLEPEGEVIDCHGACLAPG
ncbi:hypothetical protein FGG78_35765, partial [Thioclava sp. BHET1]